MKFNYTHLLPVGLIICAACFVSCKEEETVSSYDPKWKADNEAYFQSFKDSADFILLIDTLAHSDSVYYKVLETGSGATPYFTDTVNVVYKGWLTKEWATGYPIDSVFDRTAGTPYEFSGHPFGIGSGVIAGWRLALQYMKTGDKWEVAIPSSMAYGANKNGAIPPYSTLTFEIQLISITRNGVVVDKMPEP